MVHQPETLHVAEFVEGSSKDTDTMAVDRTARRPLPRRPQASAGVVVEGSGHDHGANQERSPKGKGKGRVMEDQMEDVEMEDVEILDTTGAEKRRRTRRMSKKKAEGIPVAEADEDTPGDGTSDDYQPRKTKRALKKKAEGIAVAEAEEDTPGDGTSDHYQPRKTKRTSRKKAEPSAVAEEEDNFSHSLQGATQTKIPPKRLEPKPSNR